MLLLAFFRRFVPQIGNALLQDGRVAGGSDVGGGDKGQKQRSIRSGNTHAAAVRMPPDLYVALLKLMGCAAK